MNKSDYEKVGNKIYEALATELPRRCRFWFLHDKKKTKVHLKQAENHLQKSQLGLSICCEVTQCVKHTVCRPKLDCEHFMFMMFCKTRVH